MIAIINKGQTTLDPNVYLYSVQINNFLVTTFTHYRPDGLATCLEKAAEAVKLYEKQEKK